VLDHQLREHGWRLLDPPNPYDASNYYRIQQIWFISMTEMVSVRGSSDRATITVRRRIVVFGIPIP